MSKTYETKRKMLRMFSTQVNTLTDVSHKLDLAPSTVSKHLRELENCGVIEMVYNPYCRKMKYYRLYPFSASEIMGGNRAQARMIAEPMTMGVR